MEMQAYLRPSSAAIWSKCAGYAALNAALDSEYVEETDNEVLEDGVACHWLAEQLWNGAVISPGSISPNGRELTDEMFAAVAGYHAHIRSWPVLEFNIEVKIPVSFYFTGVQDGTPDVSAYDDLGGVLYLADLKFGFRIVDVWRCAQLIVYAVTTIKCLQAQGRHVQAVELSIYQPRVAHRDGYWRTWKPTITELMELGAELQTAALRCYEPNPPCVVNPGCKNCMGAHACTSLQAAAGAAVEVSYGATPFMLTEPQLGYELKTLLQAQRFIEHRITGLTTQAESLLRKGKRIPGFEMGRAATRFRWRAGADSAVRRLGQLLGVKTTEEKTLTVAKLRHAFPGLDIQSMYAEKPTGELKLIQSDPNEAIKRFSQT